MKVIRHRFISFANRHKRPDLAVNAIIYPVWDICFMSRWDNAYQPGLEEFIRFENCRYEGKSLYADIVLADEIDHLYDFIINETILFRTDDMIDDLTIYILIKPWRFYRTLLKKPFYNGSGPDL